MGIKSFWKEANSLFESYRKNIESILRIVWVIIIVICILVLYYIWTIWPFISMEIYEKIYGPINPSAPAKKAKTLQELTEESRNMAAALGVFGDSFGGINALLATFSSVLSLITLISVLNRPMGDKSDNKYVIIDNKNTSIEEKVRLKLANNIKMLELIDDIIESNVHYSKKDSKLYINKCMLKNKTQVENNSLRELLIMLDEISQEADRNTAFKETEFYKLHIAIMKNKNLQKYLADKRRRYRYLHLQKMVK